MSCDRKLSLHEMVTLSIGTFTRLPKMHFSKPRGTPAQTQGRFYRFHSCRYPSDGELLTEFSNAVAASEAAGGTVVESQRYVGHDDRLLNGLTSVHDDFDCGVAEKGRWVEWLRYSLVQPLRRHCNPRQMVAFGCGQTWATSISPRAARWPLEIAVLEWMQPVR